MASASASASSSPARWFFFPDLTVHNDPDRPMSRRGNSISRAKPWFQQMFIDSTGMPYRCTSPETCKARHSGSQRCSYPAWKAVTAAECKCVVMISGAHAWIAAKDNACVWLSVDGATRTCPNAAATIVARKSFGRYSTHTIAEKQRAAEYSELIALYGKVAPSISFNRYISEQERVMIAGSLAAYEQLVNASVIILDHNAIEPQQPLKYPNQRGRNRGVKRVRHSHEAMPFDLDTASPLMMERFLETIKNKQARAEMRNVFEGVIAKRRFTVPRLVDQALPLMTIASEKDEVVVPDSDSDADADDADDLADEQEIVAAANASVAANEMAEKVVEAEAAAVEDAEPAIPAAFTFDALETSINCHLAAIRASIDSLRKLSQEAARQVDKELDEYDRLTERLEQCKRAKAKAMAEAADDKLSIASFESAPKIGHLHFSQLETQQLPEYPDFLASQ